MSNNCTNPPANSLQAGTFLGTDCNGNPIGAGGTFASCSDLQKVKDGNNQDLTDIRRIAEDAERKAGSAETTAGNAVTTADGAQSTADEADSKADDALDLAKGAVDVSRTALNKAVVRVIAEGDKRNIVLANGDKIPFYITDTPAPVVPTFDDDKVIGFSVKGDNVVITMEDGTEHDLTRQEFADWLSAQDSSLTTDQELADAIATGTGNLQTQINKLNGDLAGIQEQLDAINYDQATMFVRGTDLVLRNEDGTEHEAPLVSLLKVSSDKGNEIELRENGLYLGTQAPPNLSNLYVDAENGDDSISLEDGGGTKEKPFKTFTHALNLTPSNQGNNIHLKSADGNGNPLSYEITRNYYLSKGARRNIYSYGEQPVITDELVDCVTSKNKYLLGRFGNEYVRPLIRMTWREYTYRGKLYQSPPIISGSGKDTGFTFSGVDLEMTMPQLGSLPIYKKDFFRGDMDLRFSGSRIIDSEDNFMKLYRPLGGTKGVLSFNNSRIENERATGSSIISASNGSLSVTATGIDNVTNSNETVVECGGQPLTTIERNIRQVLQKPSMVGGIARHSTGVPLNVTSNFEI